MLDRIPTEPNRYAVYDDEHNFVRYEYHERADEPTQEGTPLNKATLLSDGVCAALGIPATSVPDDALAKLTVGAGRYGYYLTVKFADGSPAVGITVSGLNSRAGGSCVTDDNGNALGLSTSAAPSINISGYFDINAYSATLASTGTITPVAITLTDASPDATIITSQSFKFSRDVLVDVHAVGGGYNGTAATNSSAVGGADGYQHFRLNIPISKNVIQTAQIGAANGGGTGFAGVYSSFGSNNAGGAYAQNGISATVKKFGTGSVVAGGSGGGGYGFGNYTSGGSPFGGGGSTDGSNASGYGGGGGGGYGGTAGKGYQGVLFLQWRYA